MFDFWKDDLQPEEEEALIEKAAKEIQKRKLQTPAMLFLEMHRPLANVAGHAAVVFSPFLVPILGFNGVNDYSRVFSKRENVDRLIEKLADESNSDKPDAKEAPCNI